MNRVSNLSKIARIVACRLDLVLADSVRQIQGMTSTEQRSDTASPATPATRRVLRRDAFELLAPPREEGGRLYLQGIIAAPGVMIYRNRDGSERRELVRPEALSDPFLSSLKGVPVTIEHPVDEQGRDVEVTPENVKRYRVGTVLDARMTKGCQIVGDIVIDTEEGRAYVQDEGVSGLSPHYWAQVLDDSNRDPLYGDYDTVQVLREKPNHLANVRSPRGDEHGTHLRIDGAGHVATTCRYDSLGRLSPLPSTDSEDDMKLTADLLRELMGDEPMTVEDLLPKLIAKQEAAMAEEEEIDADADADAEPAEDAAKADMSALADMKASLDAMPKAIADAVCDAMAERFPEMGKKADAAPEDPEDPEADGADEGSERVDGADADDLPKTKGVKTSARIDGDRFLADLDLI